VVALRRTSRQVRIKVTGSHRPIRPVRTCSTYNFKGALRAPRPGLVTFHAKTPRDGGADCRAVQLPPVAGWPPEDHGVPGAGCLPLALRATSAPARTHPPAADRLGSAPQRQRGRAGLQAGPSLRRPHSEALHARGQDRSLRSRRCAIPSGLWTAAPQGFRGACRRHGQIRVLPHL